VVLEAEDLLDAVERGELRGPLRPDVDDQPGPLRVELGEHAVVLAGEADDLAATEARPQLRQRVPRHGGRHVAGHARRQGREAVLEDDDLVVALRDLGRPAVAGRAQRALVGRGEERAGLPVGGDGDPLVEQGVEAELGVGGDRRQVPRVDGVALRRRPVEVEDLAAVGEATTRADHRRPPPARHCSRGAPRR
jgi:hypothetical protein